MREFIYIRPHSSKIILFYNELYKYIKYSRYWDTGGRAGDMSSVRFKIFQVNVVVRTLSIRVSFCENYIARYL